MKCLVEHSMYTIKYTGVYLRLRDTDDVIRAIKHAIRSIKQQLAVIN